MSKWVVYYSDDTTISSQEVSPYKIERRADVQVIVQRSPEHNWVTLSGFDYYCWDKRGSYAQCSRLTNLGYIIIYYSQVGNVFYLALVFATNDSGRYLIGRVMRWGINRCSSRRSVTRE